MSESQSFLDYFVSYVYRNYSLNTSCIICPSSISKLSITSKLKSITKDQSYSQACIYTLDEFIYKQFDYNKSDDLELALKLCKILLSKGIKKSFGQLYFLSRQILDEFNEIDAQLVDIPKYFKYLEYYNVKYNNDTTNYPFISIKILEDIYKQFVNDLKSNNKYYSGLALRLVVQNKLEEIKNINKDIFIVGFNQLTNSEKQIFKAFKESSKANFFWDYDNFYTKNYRNEAGYYLRDLIKTYKEPNDFIENFDNTKLSKPNKNLNILKTNNLASEIRTLTQILQQDTFKNSKTSIILNNPTYNYLYIDAINKTLNNKNLIIEKTVMGTRLNSFLDLLYSFNTTIKSETLNNIKNLSRHLYIKTIYQDLVKKISIINTNNNYNYIPDFIYDNSLYKAILDNIYYTNTPSTSIDYLLNIFKILIRNLSNNDIFKYDTYIIKESMIYLENLKNTIDISININDKDSLKIIINLLKSHKLPQNINLDNDTYIIITTLYQTQLLESDNLIFVDMNENIFKSTNNIISTYNVKKAFSLRNFEDKNRAESYLFYRCLQNAQNIYLLYTEYDLDGHIIEENRYIKQIRYDDIFNSIEINSSNHIPNKTKRNVDIRKEFLNNINIQNLSLSATGFVNLLECPLKFYLKYILKLEDYKEKNDSYAKFGSAFHKIMEDIYKDYIGYNITKTIINDIKLNKVCNIINSSEYNNYKLNEIEKKVLIEYIFKLLDYDLKKVPFKLQNIESKLHHKFAINTENSNYNILLNGRIDRVNELDNYVEIMDYKMGNEKTIILNDNDINDLKDIVYIDNVSSNYQIQLLVYYLLYSKNFPFNKKALKINLLNVKNMFNKSSNIIESYEIKENTINKIERFIAKKLLELLTYDNSIIAQSIDKANVCKYCDYKNICCI